ncbi:hypothetical protein AHAS_Ahas03G0147000 [Arachis hypogaea]
MHEGPVLAQQDGQAVSEPSPVVDDYIPEYPLVALDMSIESLSTCSSDPFSIEPIKTSATASSQPSAVEQISLSGTLFTGDSSDGSLQNTSDDEDIEKIEIVDLTSEDDEDPERDIEIMDLTSDSD